MYLRQKYLSRRTLLRGAGVGIALPFLDAMIPAAAAEKTMAAIQAPNLGFVYFPHGAVMDQWQPKELGELNSLPQILQPLEKFTSQLNVISGLRNKPAESADPHGITAGTWLRCVAPEGETKSLDGITADQIAARTLGKDTTFPSLELSTVQGSANNGSFANTLSFRTPTQALPMEANPRKLFYRLFGYGDTAAERNAIIRETGSLLDMVSSSAASLQKTLDSSDKHIMSDYLDSVREIEKQVQKQSEQDLSSLDVPDAPAGIPDRFEDHLNLMFDLMLLAWQARLSHVASFMMDREVSMRTYTQIGVSDAFHPLSHHQGDKEKISRLTKVQTWNTTVFSRFVEKLSNTNDGDGSLLDNSLILFGSNMSNSDLHNNDPLPSVLLGGARGKVQGGRHLAFKQDTPHANLLLSVLRKTGIPLESFGDSDGVLENV